MSSLWSYVIAMLVGVAGGSTATWWIARAPLHIANADLRKENTDLREAHAEAMRLSALAAAKRIDTAVQVGQKIESRLNDVLVANARLKKEKADEVNHYTLGQPCLRGPALRLLSGSPGLSVGALDSQLPSTAGEPDAEAGSVATDTDVAGWAIETGERYEACRKQLDALIGWVEQQHEGAQ